MKGVAIADTDLATRRQITYQVKRIAGFDNDAIFQNLTVAQLLEDGMMIAGKSGIVEITAEYAGVESDNTALVVVPGDVTRDGKVSVADAVKIAKLVRGTANAADKYEPLLADMNADGKISIRDATMAAKMVRKTTDYQNGYLDH